MNNFYNITKATTSKKSVNTTFSLFSNQLQPLFNHTQAVPIVSNKTYTKMIIVPQEQQIAFRTQQLVFSPLNISTIPMSPITKSFSTFPHGNSTNSRKEHQEEENTGLEVVTSASYLPKAPNKNRRNLGKIDCGEDAYFISNRFPNSDSRVLAMGVSDGVGGYSEMVVDGKRVDPSEMAWALMENSQRYLELDDKLTPKQALTKAFEDIVNKKQVAIGGATACIVSMHRGMDEEGKPVLKLTSANLGDSAFYVIRDGKIIYRSQDQTHYFNCPYQLSVPRSDNSQLLQDDPRLADELQTPIDLYKGDVVIVASDGLTDNVFDQDVLKIVNNRLASASPKEENIAALIAHDLLKDAVLKSRSQSISTPFQEYSKSFGLTFPGGKLDDITICVSVVK
jgi:protein phosphatase PTC7